MNRSGLRGLTSQFKTEEAPQYTLTDPRLYKAMAIASVLMFLTIGGMILSANTVLAEIVLFLYNLFWFLGVVVLSGFLGVGWYVGLYGIEKNKTLISLLGVGMSVFGYGVFGGAVLTMYNASNWLSAILITSVITIGMTLLLCLYIFSGTRDLSRWPLYAVGCFIAALALSLVASFIPSLQVIVVILAIAGFTIDLGYEIWLCSRGQRSWLANGFAIYFAFAGVFVHVLQFVLESDL